VAIFCYTIIIMIYALVVILGLVIGSFLNVVIYRLHKGVSFVAGRSYCPFCKHDLSFWDLIPVFSYIFLRAKCHYCRKPISWQYPLVEASTAISFALLLSRFGLTPTFFTYIVFTCFLIIIFTYDLRYYLILDRVSIPAMVVATLLSLFVLKISAVHLLIGALIGGGFFLLQFLISRGKWIGGGDIRLGAVMGLMLGYRSLIIALVLAYILGSMVGIGLIIFGKKGWKSQVPFGTFLSVATFCAFIFGTTVVDYYVRLFL
jgi:leader peptidase (prepilin peptidase) / N-methyltransferase